LKWAQTADGFISKWPIPENKEENKISGHAAQTMVHALRAEYMAIMVGKNTVLSDNPSLTTRLVNGKNPIRIFIDKNLEVPASFAIYDASAQTIVFNALKDSVENNIQFIKLNFNEAILPQISSKLYQLNIQSVLVEGGAQLLNTFINQGLWDELMVFENTKLRFGKGIKAPFITLENTFEPIGNDKLFRVFKSKNT
jgi:diaminohydroxyphosphoribosylaminopyrimidine deaminase/5-amino-6-(5-phosphoribosylamino)uracil reductase